MTAPDSLASHTNDVPRIPGLSTRARLGFSLAAAVCSLFVSNCVYLNTPVTTDENSYLFQANVFLEGRIARPCPPVPQAFYHEMIIMDSKAGWLSRYPPAHSLWLVPGVCVDHPQIMTALAAALSMWFISGAVLCVGGSALAVCLMLLFSVYFQFMYGTLLSHTSGLVAVSVMWWAYVRWQVGGRVGFAAMAGLAWAWLFLNRTYTGALIALPLGLDALVRLCLRWRRGSQWWGTMLFGVFALVGIGGYLFYNYLAVGDPFSSTYLYYKDSWKLGFDADHGIADGLRITWENILLLDRWLWGVPGTLLVVLAAVAIGWSGSWTPVCVACTLAVIGGYAAFSFPGFNTCGPYYYFETIPFMFTIVSLAVTRLRRRSYGRILLILLTLLMAVGSLAFMKHEAKRTRKARAQDIRAHAALASAPSNALVFVTGFEEEVGRNLLLNARGIHSDPLIVADWGDRNVLAARAFPDRTCCWLKPDQDHVEPFTVVPTNIVYDFSADGYVPATGRRETDANGTNVVLVADALRDKAGYLAHGERVTVIAGQYRITCRLRYEGVTPQAPLRLDVRRESNGRPATSHTLDGSSTNDVVTILFDVPRFDEVEPRIYYGGSGRVIFSGMCLEEVPAAARD
jgi:hypothetical protein